MDQKSQRISLNDDSQTSPNDPTSQSESELQSESNSYSESPSQSQIASDQASDQNQNPNSSQTEQNFDQTIPSAEQTQTYQSAQQTSQNIDPSNQPTYQDNQTLSQDGQGQIPPVYDQNPEYVTPSEGSSKSKLIIFVIVIVVLLLITGLGVFFINRIGLFGNSTDNNNTSDDQSNQNTNNQNFDLESVTNKEMLAENQTYIVYLINVDKPGDIERNGEIVVVNKDAGTTTKIEGTFSIFGSTALENDTNGKYLLLSNGTYSSRDTIIISLTENKQAVNNFCVSSGGLFWNDSYIYANCDFFENRPWGVGEAPSIVMVNLISGRSSTLLKSDELRHFAIDKIENDMLYYTETYVEDGNDWQTQGLEKTQSNTLDLSIM